MGKALALLLVAVAAGLMVYWLAGPKRLETPHIVPSSSVPPLGSHSVPNSDGSTNTATQGPPSDTPPAPDASIPAPRTASQQAHDELEAKRAPYYHWLREQAGDLVSDVVPAEEDGAILTITLSAADSAAVMPLVDRVVAPQAYHYGFRRVRFYLPNPIGSPERFSLYAESTVDAEGAWHTFIK